MVRTKSPASRSRLARKAGAALLGLCAFTSAQAVDYCVDSASSLLSAMVQASITPAPYDVIKIQQGNYVMGTSMSFEFPNRIFFEGGYTANCTSRVVNPANTVIDIGLGHQFNLRQSIGAPEALISVDGLTFTHADNTLYFAAGDSGDFSDDVGSITISRTRFTNLHTSNYEAIRFSAIDNRIGLNNVLIDNVSASECGIYMIGDGDASVRFNHVTADLALGDDVCLSDTFDSIAIYNSILWGSGATSAAFVGDLSSGTEVLFANNVMSGYSITGAIPVTQNKINAAPGWIDPAAGNYRLQTLPLSPAINSANLLVPGGEPSTDIEGNTRIVGTGPDRGAYESSYNDYSTLTVINIQDSGAGSLRQAILDANTSPNIAKTIKFNIRTPGNVPICPAIISLNTVLPAIASKILIDGYSQPGSVTNNSEAAFNANLCVLVKSGGASLANGFRVPADSGAGASLRLRGLGLGGFSQPLILLGGEQHLITGNQFGGSVGNVSLAGAGLNAISIGVNASGSLIVGGISLADRNAIGGASFGGIDVQSSVLSSTDKCQIVNNLIGMAPNDLSTLPNNIGINVNGSGCAIVGNRVAGNVVYNVAISGDNNVVQRNLIGINTQGGGVANNGVIGLQVSGGGNIIGAGGAGGSISANTIRFNNGGGVVVRGDAAVSNSLNANLIYDNGSSFNAMDIDLSPTIASAVGVGIAALSANDAGDTDVGPNALQNFPVGTSMVYTDLGTGAGMLNRGAIITATLDSLPGTHRVDAYYSSSANQLGLQGRGHAEVYLGHTNVPSLGGGGVANFSMPIVIPTQLTSGVVSFTATDSAGNTSEIGTGLSITAAVVNDVFKSGFE